ncbi:MAG: glutamate formimidoyltransferase [Planctomycetes bacterium]|nr:glutamate formimidoyltransferase [Planctomycetota bacterium]
MSNRIVECVPNISEGRDPRKIEQIVTAAREVEGVDILDVDPGRETNRTVITMVGAPEPVLEAAFRLIARAAELIDMSKHSGAHARHGATDVCPFVPVAGVTMADCVELANRLGQRVGDELGIPVYLYDQAARVPERRSLAKVRAGEYEALPEKMKKPEWRPDFGPARFHAKAGVVTIGAREFLIAYNVNLNSTRKEHADDIAFELREKGRALRVDQGTPFYESGRLVKYAPSRHEFPCAYTDFVARSLDELAAHYEAQGRDLMAELEFFDRDPAKLEGVNVMKKGLFEECRGVGWVIPEYGRAQLSFNLTNYKVTAVHDVYEQARELARDRGLVVTGSEIVGLIPYPAMRETGEFYLAAQGSSRGAPLPDLLECAAQSLGLRDVAGFEIETRVLGVPRRAGKLAAMKVVDLADEVSRATPAPGGGSIAALAGSLGAALAAMVGNLSFYKKGLEDRQEEMEELAMKAQILKDELLGLIDADTDAFSEVLAAMRLPKATDEEKATREAAIQAGYKIATDVPYRSALLCLETLGLCRKAAELGLSSAISDAGVGALMARSGLIGAVYNVRINLGSITDEAWVAERRTSLADLVARGEALERETRDLVEAAF